MCVCVCVCVCVIKLENGGGGLGIFIYESTLHKNCVFLKYRWNWDTCISPVGTINDNEMK